MANTETILRKLELSKKNPDTFQPLSNTELADLVVVVLSQVRLIEKAISDRKLDIDQRLGTDITNFAEKTKEEVAQLKVQLVGQIQNEVIRGAEALLETSTELEKRVNAALENIRNGEDGIVSEAEIERAASIAFSLIELPNFDAIITEGITSNGEAVRDALELLQGEDRYSVEIADVTGLQDRLNQLSLVRASNGGTIGKQQVYGFIRQAIADGIITSGSSLPDQTGADGKFLKSTGIEGSEVWESIPGGGGITTEEAVDAVAAAIASGTHVGIAITYNDAGDAISFELTGESYTTAEQTKVGYLSVTQPVDLDAIEARVNELDASVILKGTWDASSGSFPASGTAQAGWSYIVSVGGTVDGVVFAANDRIVAITDNASTSTYASNWHKLDYTDQVLSVAGKTGAVTLDKNDVGLGNVDNTSDLNKPVSTATQAALDLKVSEELSIAYAVAL